MLFDCPATLLEGDVVHFITAVLLVLLLALAHIPVDEVVAPWGRAGKIVVLVRRHADGGRAVWCPWSGHGASDGPVANPLCCPLAQVCLPFTFFPDGEIALKLLSALPGLVFVVGPRFLIERFSLLPLLLQTGLRIRTSLGAALAPLRFGSKDALPAFGSRWRNAFFAGTQRDQQKAGDGQGSVPPCPWPRSRPAMVAELASKARLLPKAHRGIPHYRNCADSRIIVRGTRSPANDQAPVAPGSS